MGNKVKEKLLYIKKENEEKLVEENLHAVKSIIRFYFSDINFIEYDDLVQIGNFGLLKAIRYYDIIKHKYKLSTHIKHWVIKEIKKAIRDINRQKRKFDKINLISIDQNITLKRTSNFLYIKDIIDDYKQLWELYNIENEEILNHIFQNTNLSKNEQYIIKQLFNGLDYDNIAKELNKKPMNISRTAYKARQKIKKYLQESKILKKIC